MKILQDIAQLHFAHVLNREKDGFDWSFERKTYTW